MQLVGGVDKGRNWKREGKVSNQGCLARGGEDFQSF